MLQAVSSPIAIALPRECASCERNASDCRLNVQGPCCPDCRCDVPLLADGRADDLARKLAQSEAQLLKATQLLTRCELFIPKQMQALETDVREFLGIDDRGFRVVR